MAKLFRSSRRSTDPRRGGRNADANPTEPRAPLPPRGIYAVMGATGGVGATSAACALALDIAAEIARDRPAFASLSAGESRVCLIDLDFECGACAHHLDLLPTLSTEDLRRPPSQFDSAVLAAMVDQSVAGVTLLGAVNGDPGHPDPRTVLALLDAASQLFDHVVLDVPRHIQPWTAAALAGADVAMVMCELTVPSLHMARLRRAQLGTVLQQAGQTLHPVIGKLERRAGRGALSLKDAETALGVAPFATLPLDPEALRVVVNSGEPLTAARPDCRYLRGVTALRGRYQALMAQDYEDAPDARDVAETGASTESQPCRSTASQAAA